MPNGFIEIRRRALREQVENVKSFITEPVGVFETTDKTIKTFRKANKDALRQLGVAR